LVMNDLVGPWLVICLGLQYARTIILTSNCHIKLNITRYKDKTIVATINEPNLSQ